MSMGPDEAGQLLEMGVADVAAHDVVGSTGDGGFGLVGVAGDDRDRAPWEEALESSHGGEPDDPGAHDEHSVPVGGSAAQQAVAGDREGFVETGAAVGNRVGERVQHRGVGQRLLPPTPTETLGESQGAATGDDPAVEVET
jgi:hypothetical protein